MLLKNYGFKLSLLSTVFFSITLAFKKPELLDRTQYIAPPEVIRNLTFGHSIQLSDSFWVRSNQDFDYCDQPTNSKNCKSKSWLFKIIDMTTDLDRNFFEAFHYGALALTIIISDVEGATLIFDKGVAQFPNDWRILYTAGYHALVEEKNKSKAAKLYFEAAKNGAPSWVHVMAGRLAAEGGQDDYAAEILEHMIATNQDEKFVERLKSKLNELEK